MKTDFKKRLWTSAAIIFGSIILGAGVLFYLAQNVSANATKLISDRASAQARAVALEKLAELQQDAPVAATYTADINALLPTQYQLINFKQWLANLGTTDGVTATFAFQGTPTPSQPGTPGTAPISLDIQGPFSNVINCLQDLESKAPGYLVQVSSFDLTNDANNNANLTAQGMLFFQ